MPATPTSYRRTTRLPSISAVTRGLFRDGQVARAGAGDDDGARAVGFGRLADDSQARRGAVVEPQTAGQRPLQPLRDGGRLGGVEARHEHARLTVVGKRAADAGDLLGGLARAVDDLRDALAHAALQIEGRIPQVGDARARQLPAQLAEGLLHRRRAGRDALEQLLEFQTVHGVTCLSSRGRVVGEGGADPAAPAG